MSSQETYILDANVFIEAHQRYYPFDVFPGFWKAIRKLNQKKRAFSIDRVKTELQSGRDALTQWANEEESKSLFKKTEDVAVIRAYREVVNFVQASAQYSPVAKSDFASGADGWIVAFAMENVHVVVTQEVRSPETKSRVPIPNVCQHFKVDFVNTLEMLRRLGVQLPSMRGI
jgi:hypothetical protein